MELRRHQDTFVPGCKGDVGERQGQWGILWETPVVGRLEPQQPPPSQRPGIPFYGLRCLHLMSSTCFLLRGLCFRPRRSLKKFYVDRTIKTIESRWIYG